MIGIERGDRSIQNPPPTTRIERGDVLWLVGERSKLIRLSEGNTIV